LIGNAIRHNGDRALSITVSARRVGRRWELSVADDGVGIAPEFADKIWGMFQTLERRDKSENTGIGLSVVRKIVESHAGKAWVESEYGRGARFSFTWPADPPFEPDEAPRG
jgi:signal transduction histidine kinase